MRAQSLKSLVRVSVVGIAFCGVLGSAFGPMSGCRSAKKVHRTFALSELSGQARQATKDGDHQRAFELWTEFVDRRPHAHFAQYELGMSEVRLGMYSAGVGHLMTAHDLRPMNVEYIEDLGNALILDGRVDEMMVLMRQTVEEGGTVEGHLRLARFAGRVGMLDEAKSAIRSAMIFDNGEHAEPYVAMADFAQLAGDRALEIESLRKALWFDPSSDALDSRFLGLGVTPGPSLAIDPRVSE